MTMRYPEFFDEVPIITMYDPLAKFLGAMEGGIIEYRYVDAVKLAGHSCPTVAAAWLMTARALEALYPRDVPERGAVRVDFRHEATSGVTGVIANVVTLVTGATHDTGFKGLAGRFDRRNLLFFNAAVSEEIRFTRQDSGAAVDVVAHLERVPSEPHMGELMAACITGRATDEVRHEFGRLWQARVRRLLTEHAHDDETIPVRAA
jgi:hypothetical protein